MFFFSHSHHHSHSLPEWSEWLKKCVWVYLVPRAQSAQRMERGEGREANWLSHPLRRERERERERETDRQTNTGKTRRGWEEGNEKRSNSADLVSAGGLAMRVNACFAMSSGGYLAA